jgi:hypothetical protein
MKNMTPEEVQQNYSATMDSVNLLNAGKPESMDDAEWADCVQRNVDHLKLMVEKDYWVDQDLSPLHAAIDANGQ